MSKVIKPLSTELALSATVGNTVSTATMVRVVNLSASDLTITRSTSANTKIGTFSMFADQESFVRKDSTDILFASGAGANATSIAILD
jgi:hypothetical protein